MKKLFLLLVAVLSISLCASAQTRTVKGTVVYAGDQEPLPGATILPVGGGNGVATDIDGKFTLEVPSKVTMLNVSYVGMVTKQVAITSGDMRIELTNSENNLDEVMVVAYGTAKKSTYTGSAAVVKADDINKVQSSNAVNALNGKVSGVQMNNASGQPGATSPTIRIRGISSINAGSAPLYIVDGAPYDGDLNNISAQDIESMTVLKDAASNALYGSRGANGVIVITTKRGKQGDAKVSFDAKWGGNTRATQDYNTIKDPAQYYEMYYGALKGYFTNTLGMSDAAAHVQANTAMVGNGSYGLGYNVYNVPEGQFLIGTNGKLNPNATLGNVVNYKGTDYMLMPDSWMDNAYKNSLRQEYNVSVNGGTDRSSFFASVNYLDNEGIAANSDYQRFTGRMKADYQVKNWLKVGGNMSYSHFDANSLGEDGSSNSSGNIFAYATQVAPIYPLFIRDAQGNIMKDGNGFTMYDFGDGKNGGSQRMFLSGANPYITNVLDTDNYEGNAFTANGFFEVKFLKDFKFTWNSGVTVDETRQNAFTNPYYGQYASSNGMSYKYHTRSVAQNHQQLLTWGRQFGKSNVDVMIGHEYYNRDYYYLYASKTNFLDPNNIELAGGISENGSISYTTQYNTEGYFGRAQYDYDSKYFASASFRRDASSRFHPENRWGNFWSAGAAWNIAREEFMTAEWIDLLKLKASYGSQGNDNIGNYLYVNTFDIVNSNGNPAAVPSMMGNKDITWETQGNFNTGIDFGMWNGRFSGTVEYFYRKTTDMLFSFPLPPSFGYTSYYANVGDMRNQGVELELEGTPIVTRDFSWTLRANLTHYKNKITYLPEERRTMECDGVEGYSSGSYYYGEGISLYTLRMRKFAGIDENGNSLWYKNSKDEEGNDIRVTTDKYSEADYYLCGTALPDVYGGFGTTLNYKGFDLSVDFSYQIGGQVYDGDYAGFMSSPTSSSKGRNFHADLLNAWSTTNQGSDIPRFVFGDEYTASTSDRFLTDASYLSLNNINFGYTLPLAVTRKAGMDKVRFYVSADNVWVWSQRQGLDPRQSISGGATSSYYAPIRTISGGLSLTF
ncbi:MAG: TonB-dependent receptor [Muribaculaceae bacterium]|nr:TonB-dependent receptor [Muribaculaceae bacterium]